MDQHLEDYYHHKTILVTGATGFVGKAILWNVLKVAGHVIEKVYVLIRPKRISAGAPSQRILDEIINTPAFNKLVKLKFNGNKDLLREKLIPVPYDLSLPHMGLSMEDSVQMKDTNIVIHCASTSEYENSLEWNLETNVLGTIRLMDYLDSCLDICSFVHMSPIHIYQDIPYDCEKDAKISEYVYDLGFGDPEDFLKELLGADEKELSVLVKRILQKHSTLHLFTKALVEHLIVRRVDQVRLQVKQGGREPYPVAIFRSNYIGPSATEPTPGWTCGMSGVSAWLALFGYAIPTIQPDQANKLTDIIPVDFVARTITHTMPFITYPGSDFILPLATIANSIVPRKMSSSRNSASSTESVTNKVKYFPYIFNMTPPTQPITWYEAYSVIQDYWSRPSHTILTRQKLPTAQQYFSSNKTLSTARFLMRYYFNNQNGTQQQTHKEGDQQKWMELASNIRSNLTKQSRYTFNYESIKLNEMPFNNNYDNSPFDWYGYFMQSCFGVQVHILHCGLYIRTPIVLTDVSCALYPRHQKNATKAGSLSVIDAPILSVIYTEDEMKQRLQFMMDTITASLRNPLESVQDEKNWKPVWIEYLNDTLEDWCDEGSVESLDIRSRKKEIENRWKLKIDENAELTKVTVLNDPGVGEAIHQVAKRAGMPVGKVMDEAAKSLYRIQERTELSYSWFAACFLQKLLKKMFSGIHISNTDLQKVRDILSDNKEKKIVYIPVSKSALDPVLVWFLAIRYDLPIPALILDEALAILGPFSDLLRLAGATFIKRDPNSRSTLTAAVTKAYLTYMLNTRGAITLILEQVRSRIGAFQPPFNDGLIEMIIDSSTSEIAFVPINVTYEELPDLNILINGDLQQTQSRSPKSTNIRTDAKKLLSRPNTITSNRMSTPTKLTRPSESTRAHRVRSRSLGTGMQVEESNLYDGMGIVGGKQPQVVHCGRLLVGIGMPIVFNKESNNESAAMIAKELASKVQVEQKNALVISSISLVAAVLLFSRVKGNYIDFETMKRLIDYLFEDIKDKGFSIDWQGFEDTETIIYYNIRLLEKNTNTAIAEETKSNGVLFRISTRSESVLQLAYYANQLREIFVLDSIYAATYLSFGSRPQIVESEFIERFVFLANLFQLYFKKTWNVHNEYDRLAEKYYHFCAPVPKPGDSILEEPEQDEELEQTAIIETRVMQRLVLPKDDELWSHLNVQAWFIYPTLDSFWVTLCSLSALNEIKALPLSLVPTLSQWIGMHIISGRRTVYNEVLSKEHSASTLRSLIELGLLKEQPVKSVLSPDAQMLIQALGLSTNDYLIMLAEDKENESKKDPVAELCKKIEQVRVKQENINAPLTIYEKCKNQIRSLKKSTDGNSFSRRQGADLVEKKEEDMIQLGYALIQSMGDIVT